MGRVFYFLNIEFFFAMFGTTDNSNTFSCVSIQECCGVGDGEGCCMAVNQNGLSDNHEGENDNCNVGL